MPNNEQRRQVGKRKLERQLERRQERAKTRRQLTVALSAVAVVVVAGLVILLVSVTRGSGNSTAAASTTAAAAAASTTAAASSTAAAAALPTARATPLAASVSCTYPTTAAQPASKANTPPTGTGVSTQGTAALTMATSAGEIGLALDRALAPCTVNSFLSLTGQKYFDATTCHRLTTSGILVLQCGDPTGTGTGGPGYSFANEFPTDQYPTGDAALTTPANYPRGAIAMANAGVNTNGSQFFLLYGNSPLPPSYTVFGTISTAGLAVLDKIAAAGTADGTKDGAPKTAVTITTMTAAA